MLPNAEGVEDPNALPPAAPPKALGVDDPKPNAGLLFELPKPPKPKKNQPKERPINEKSYS